MGKDTALLEGVCTSANELLSQLPSVTTCELVRPCATATCLSALLSLHNLQKFVPIDGMFEIRHLPLHLTLEHANLHAGSCCTSLKKLQLFSSGLSGLEAIRIAACLELETLSCRASYIGAVVALERFLCSKPLVSAYLLACLL